MKFKFDISPDPGSKSHVMLLGTGIPRVDLPYFVQGGSLDTYAGT